MQSPLPCLETWQKSLISAKYIILNTPFILYSGCIESKNSNIYDVLYEHDCWILFLTLCNWQHIPSETLIQMSTNYLGNEWYWLFFFHQLRYANGSYSNTFAAMPCLPFNQMFTAKRWLLTRFWFTCLTFNLKTLRTRVVTDWCWGFITPIIAGRYYQYVY